MSVLLLRHQQFLGHRKKPSWVFAPQPRRCLHPSQGGVCIDPPPLGNFTQRNVGVQMLCVERQPFGVRGCLWVLVLSDTPGLTGKVQGGGAHWQWHQPVIGELLLLCPSLRQHLHAGLARGWLEITPRPIETKAAT